MAETTDQQMSRFWKQAFRDLDPEKRPQGTKGFLFMIDTDRLFDARDRVRRHLDDEAIAALAQSIVQRGQVEPITVCRRVGYKRGHTPTYEVLHGHRRVAACRLLGQPVKARLVQGECRGLNLVLNVTQQELSGVEIADAIAAMRQDLQISVARTAKMIAKTERYVERAQRVAALPVDVREILAMRGVPLSILFELTVLPEPVRKNVVDEIARGREFSRPELRAMRPGETKSAPQPVAVRAIEAQETTTPDPSPAAEATQPGTAVAPAKPAAEPVPREAPNVPPEGATPSPAKIGASAQRVMPGAQESHDSERRGVPAETTQSDAPKALTHLTALRQTLAAINGDVLQAVGSNACNEDLLDAIEAELERVRDAIKAITAKRRAQRRPRLVVHNDTNP